MAVVAAGTVSKGRLWGTAVAVKRLKQDLVSEEDRENLVKEVTVLSQLRHPNVVLYIGACLTPPNVCIVTEWYVSAIAPTSSSSAAAAAANKG